MQDKQKPINILFGATSDYLPYAAVTARSVAEKSNGRPVNIHFLYADIVKRISNRQRQKCMDLARKSLQDYSVQIFFYDITDLIPMFRGQNVGMWGTEISMTHYFYLTAPLVLPQDIDEVIYLDTDMIVNCDLSCIYDMDMGDNLLLVASPSGLESEPDTFNSGFSKMNLSLWRKNNVLTDLLAFGRQLPRCHLCDQNLLNKYFGKSHVMFVDKFYNMFPQCVNAEDIPKIKIIHYAGIEFGRPFTKPWKDINKCCANEWWKYAKQTNFYKKFIKEQKKMNRQHRGLRRLWHHIKRMKF